MQIDANRLDGRQSYRLLTSCVVPRPIAFISSLDAEGRVNAAPFSYFNAVASDPPTLCISIGRHAPDREKDTLRNIRSRGEFTVNIVDEDLAAPMNDCATDFPPEISEVEAVGLATAPGVSIGVPRLSDAPVSLECRLFKIVDLETAYSLILGRVVYFHVRDDVYVEDRGYVDPHRLRAIGRLGGPHYTRSREIFTMERRSYDAWRQQEGEPSR